MEIVYSVGGSHKQWQRERSLLQHQAIPYRWLGGNVDSGRTKRYRIAVDQQYADRMKTLGFTRSRHQFEG